jgi:hypothetical protein
MMFLPMKRLRAARDQVRTREPRHSRSRAGWCGFLLLLLVCVVPWNVSSADGDEPSFVPDHASFQQHAAPLLKQFCLECHGPELQEGEFRVDEQLTPLMTNRANAARWSEVVNVLNSHEMPPEDSPQPDAESVAELVDWVTGELNRAEQFNQSADIVIRRLNRAEYQNTIRDLIGIDYDVSVFPEDAAAGGFDNNGGALSMSPMQIETYLAAAREILDKALVTGEQPASICWRFEPESGDSDRNRVRYGENNAIVNGGQNPVQGNGRMIAFDRWDKKINARDFRVPIAGPYVVRVRAGGRVPSREEVLASVTKIHDARLKERMANDPKGEKYFRAEMQRDLDDVRTSSVYNYGPPRMQVTVHQGGQPEILGRVDVTGGFQDDELQVLEFPVEMGTLNSGITLQYDYAMGRTVENIAFFGHDDFSRPELLVDWLEIDGPVYPQWPPASHLRLLPRVIPDSTEQQRECAQEILKGFMPRAYRRPVEESEIQSKLSLYDQARQQTDDFIEAIKIALSSILVSPNFLYLAEPGSASRLTDFEIASRLSYFLWSTMPDDELIRLASEGKLSEARTRVVQVDRMLADDRITAFVDNFAGQWLGLREVGQNPPATDLFPRYDDHLEASMVGESKAFFAEVLQHDLSLDHFIDSDFAMLNERLARFYDIEGVRGDDFRRVSLRPEWHRGGVLTQAAILSVTSNGTRTTPVRRGTWILKTLLNADPGLPVANAGEISPKVPGIDKATVRQRLEIHRELPQCARCHDRIDPLGFALENYNAAGQWRDREGFGYKGRVGEDDPLIDASGKLSDGTMIDGIDGLKQALLSRRSQLHAALATKLFSYALGREMTLVDRADIDRAVKLTQTHQADLRTIIKAIVSSDAFLKR